ncbi:MAG: chromosome segregation protein SMC [Pseudomonadota bacterium]
MQFNKLRLTGFKSFVDPTDLMISEGLTGVVGPNGCGKSNLLEALRWVMGENRPTSMRGAGMEDVIFSGAATRGARNFAEVAIQIDNSDRLAPQGFNETDQIEIVRRITRDVGSAYKVNGKDVRARDVQMLFADASTGAHSPALVRQGQIAELVNAKPTARRRILEEAAGISGLYQRRHEAELKLKATETNLARVDDVLEQLAAQLAQLARQARQAARYRQIGSELRQAEGALLYRRWKEADATLAVAEKDLTERVTVAAQSERAVQEALGLRVRADEALPPLREEQAIAGAVLQRLLVSRDRLASDAEAAQARIVQLSSQLDQLQRDIEREETLNRDAGDTISALESEQQALTEAGEGYETRQETSAAAAHEAAELLQTRETEFSELTEDVARLAARHQSAGRLVEDSHRTLNAARAAATRARTSAEEADAEMLDLVARRKAAQDAEADALQRAAGAEAALKKADDARSEVQAREADARAERSEAEGELNAVSAEANALVRLLERDTAESGQVLDAVQVEPGYEQALGAALADDLRAPETDADGPSGWILLDAYSAPQALPEQARPLSDHVRAPGVLARRLSQIGCVAQNDGARLQPGLRPGQRLVSREGDLWRWDGYHARSEDAPSTAALRLAQLNRLEDLKQQSARATARMEGAVAAHEALRTDLVQLTEADTASRAERKLADSALADAARALSRAEADLELATSKRAALDLSVTRHEDEATAAGRSLTEAETAQKELADLDRAREGVDALRKTVEAARIAMIAKRAAHDELRRDEAARVARAQEVASELTRWRHRLDTAHGRAAELSSRRAETADSLKDAEDQPEVLERKFKDLEAEVTCAEARCADADDMLAKAEAVARDAAGAEREAERAAGEAREARARAEALTEAARATRAAAEARISEDLDLSPEALLDSLDGDPDAMPDADRIEAEVNRLKRQRDALGAVNLRAEEDARAIEDEHQALGSEKADLEAAIGTLRSGIASLNREGRERLLTAFEQVNDNFSNLFKHLFGGGEANLVMVESDDPLEAGLEIMCQPPGKKLSTLTLLSGGEQTLTAMALIFAVFLANPAPICVLDEVDAPLDDANVGRFCDLLDEMCRRTETRFLIITHHAVTMSRMDRLFGVTMGEQGVSQLVSVDLRRAEQMVA